MSSRNPDILGRLLSPRFFKALGDPTRVGILRWLAQGRAGCTVNEVTAASAVGQSAVSRHLSILRDAGILEATRRGKEVCYQVRVQRLVAMLRELADALEACCPPSKLTEVTARPADE